MKQILVTGGAGFIGHHTVNLLISEGYHVVVLDDFSTGNLANLPKNSSNLTLVKGTTLDDQAVAQAAQNADAILHLAAKVSVPLSIEKPAETFETNVQGFLNILEFVRHNAPETRVVYASSAAVYGNCQDICREDMALQTPLSPYALEKQMNENYGKLYASFHGLSVMGLRYFNVFGSGQDPSSPYSGVISIFIDRAASGQPLTIFGDGKQTRDFISVKDVASANFLALQSRENGVLNIATGKSHSIKDLADIIAAKYKVKLDFQPERDGDIKTSSASVSLSENVLGFKNTLDFKNGLQELMP